jgi:HEPN domain-containing protein
MVDAQRELVRAWLAKAASDLKSAGILSSAEEAPLDTAIYHCQQAAEKAVKAFLLSRGVTPDKTHDVRHLTLRASRLEAKFSEYINSAAVLTPYAWEFRYPVDLAETYPTCEEFGEASRHAQSIYDFVLTLIPAEARP